MIVAAVERGAGGTRLVVPGPDGRAEPVAVLPAGTPVAVALDELVGNACGPVALVHPPDAVPSLPEGRAVVPVAAPVAVLAGRRGRFLVVDAGRSGTDITVVDDGCVRASERLPVGGDRLDALVAAATGCAGVREALSTVARVDAPGHGRVEASTVEAALRPAFDVLVSRVVATATGVDEVVLCGGVARTPLLAELLDERVRCPVRVLPEPDLAAVRGALEIVVVRSPVARVPPPADHDAPPTRRRPRLLPAVAGLGMLLVGGGTALGATAAPSAPPDASLVQYGYTMALPAGWEHSGGDPERRRTLLTRAAAPDGVELVSVERSPLGYDAVAEPDRARAELAAVHRATAGVGELRPDTVAGRPVLRYRQQAGPDAVVDWVVLFDGTDELAVGCRHPTGGPTPELRRACADVVGSVRVTG